jgi:hypothetical protein
MSGVDGNFSAKILVGGQSRSILAIWFPVQPEFKPNPIFLYERCLET